MKRGRWWGGLLLAAALLTPAASFAQPKGKGKPPAAPSAPPAGGATDVGDLDAPPAGGAADPKAGGDATKPAGAAGDGSEDKGICELEPSACPKAIDVKAMAAKEVNADVVALQQLYVLKARRLELNPYWSFSLNDQFVSHPGPGIAANYYISNVLAVGANFNYYGGLNDDSDFNFQNRRATRVAVPLNEYLLGVNANMTYVPIYGKFASLADFIFQYDGYLVGGVGALWTRPIPVIDPDNRNFSYDPRLAFNVGFGLRVFLTRWLAVTMELRNYIYLEKLENLKVPNTTAEQQNKDNWYGDSSLTNNVQAQLGFSFFLPPSVSYRLPK
ncbi:MAG: outer membrane beta-barrel domain-containing protein [Polyangiaceae bacterium]